VATLNQLITEVRSRLDQIVGGPVPEQWSDAEITNWLNEGQRDVARRAEVLQANASIPTTVGVQQYDAPPDVIRIHRVEWSAGANQPIYPLEYRDFNSMDSVWWTSQAITQSRPVWWTAWGFPPNLKLVLYPKPASSGALKLFYYRMPVDMVSDTDNADVPTGWEDLLVLWAEHVALRKDADRRWVEAKQLYEERLNQMIEITRRWTDQADALQSYTGRLVPAWLHGGGDWWW
jgi:hypothetical protein